MDKKPTTLIVKLWKKLKSSLNKSLSKILLNNFEANGTKVSFKDLNNFQSALVKPVFHILLDFDGGLSKPCIFVIIVLHINFIAFMIFQILYLTIRTDDLQNFVERGG